MNKPAGAMDRRYYFRVHLNARLWIFLAAAACVGALVADVLARMVTLTWYYKLLLGQ